MTYSRGYIKIGVKSLYGFIVEMMYTFIDNYQFLLVLRRVTIPRNSRTLSSIMMISNGYTILASIQRNDGKLTVSELN